MAGLREMLLKEQSRLEQILKKTEERMKDAPDGSLRLSRSGKSVQYYRCMPGKQKNGEYLPKAEGEMVRRLAQKSYDQKVEKLAGKRLAQIKRMVKDYEDDEIERLFLNEHKERQKLIRPVEPTWEQRLEAWINEEYLQKEFREDVPVILTERGERVRSKSEKLLADYFWRSGILYKYERPLHLKGFGIVHPDFTFLSRKTRQEVYWEHDGRMDDPVYAQRAIRKIQAYEQNGIYPGEKLILTFETEKSVLDLRMVKRLAEKYLI